MTRPTCGTCTTCGSTDVALVKAVGRRELSPDFPIGYGCEVCS